MTLRMTAGSSVRFSPEVLVRRELRRARSAHLVGNLI